MFGPATRTRTGIFLYPKQAGYQLPNSRMNFWGDRRDSHPLRAGSQPACSTLRTRPPCGVPRCRGLHSGENWGLMLVHPRGIEPQVSRLSSERSTTELRVDGGEDGNRTRTRTMAKSRAATTPLPRIFRTDGSCNRDTAQGVNRRSTVLDMPTYRLSVQKL